MCFSLNAATKWSCLINGDVNTGKSLEKVDKKKIRTCQRTVLCYILILLTSADDLQLAALPHKPGHLSRPGNNGS